MLVVGGTVTGKSNLYVRLDERSRHLLGRRVLDQKSLDEPIRALGLDVDDLVEVSVETSGGGRVRILDVRLPSEPEEGQEASVATYDAPFAPPAGTFPRVPERDPSYLVTKDVKEVLDAIINLVESDDRVNIRLTGPQGTGKTSLAKAIAANLQWNFIKVDVATVEDKEAWFASITADKHEDADVGVTNAHPTMFLYGMTQPNTVVLLDEFNRVPAPVHGGIYGLLDEHGYAWSQDLQAWIERAPNVLVVSTMNVEDANVGVFELDAATKDRFPIEIRLELLPEGPLAKVIEARSGCEKAVAQQLAKLAHEVERLVGAGLEHGTGTRPLISAAKLMSKGIGWVAANNATTVAAFDHRGGADSERSIVMNLVEGLNIF